VEKYEKFRNANFVGAGPVPARATTGVAPTI